MGGRELAVGGEAEFGHERNATVPRANDPGHRSHVGSAN